VLISAATLINKFPGIIRNAIIVLYNIYSGKDFLFDNKKEYINSCINRVVSITITENTSDLEIFYRQFAKVRKNFVEVLEKKMEHKDNKNYLPQEFYNELDEQVHIPLQSEPPIPLKVSHLQTLLQ
jgi:hypothetical protein